MVCGLCPRFCSCVLVMFGFVSPYTFCIFGALSSRVLRFRGTGVLEFRFYGLHGRGHWLQGFTFPVYKDLWL